MACFRLSFGVLCIWSQFAPVMPVQHTVHARQGHCFAQRLLNQRPQARDDDHATLTGIVHDFVQRSRLLLQCRFGPIAQGRLGLGALACARCYGAVRATHLACGANGSPNDLRRLVQRQPQLQRQQHRLSYEKLIGAGCQLHAQQCRFNLFNAACRSGHDGLLVGKTILFTFLLGIGITSHAFAFVIASPHTHVAHGKALLFIYG
jgi:hypothetical protein